MNIEPQDKSFVCEPEPQDKSFVCEPEDLSSYTFTDLEQLLEINKKTLEHYNKVLEDNKNKLQDPYFIGTRMCKEQTIFDIQHIEKEIMNRKNKK